MEAAMPETWPAEIDDPAHLAHIVAPGDERRQRPGDRRGRRQPADRNADPDQRLRGSVRMRRAQNAQPEGRAANQHNAPDCACIPPALDENSPPAIRRPRDR